jgi:glycosyltransferase involved in cell wall biosynthesis
MMGDVRVAAFMNTEMVSGPGRQLAAMVKPLREAGVSLTLICVQHADGRPTPFTRFLEQQEIPFMAIRTDGRLLPLVHRVEDAIRELDPHIFQTHSYRPAFVAWRLRRAGARWRWIGFFHGYTQEDVKVRLYNQLDRWLLRRADQVVVVAAPQLARFRNVRSLIQIPNAVLPPASSVVRPSWMDELEHLSKPRIGFIGRLSYEKGVDVLIDALVRLKHQGHYISAVIAGDGPERIPLEQRAAPLLESGRIAFLGNIDHVSRLYEVVDGIALPSRTEGMPNVLLEAAAADCPMVATAVGDVPAILADEDAGMVIPILNSEALSKALERMLQVGRTEEGRAARRAIANRYSLATRVDAHVALYRSMVSA